MSPLRLGVDSGVSDSTALDPVPCGRCTMTFTRPGEALAHYVQLHGLGIDLAEREAADQAQRCPGCGHRGGLVHNRLCTRKDWRPLITVRSTTPVSPPTAWVYSMPVLLPLRVAVNAFRKSYVAHVKEICGGSYAEMGKTLGYTPAGLYVLLSREGVTNPSKQACRRCRRPGHNARGCPKRRAR